MGGPFAAIAVTDAQWSRIVLPKSILLLAATVRRFMIGHDFCESIFLRPELAMVRLVRFAVPALLAFGTPARAQSIFLTYEQWEQLPTTLREIYVAGAIDQLSAVGVPAGLSSAKHYNECIVKSGMSLGQIAEGTKKFMEMHSDLRQKPAPRAVMEYLITLCGLPTPSEGALSKEFSSAGGHGANYQSSPIGAVHAIAYRATHEATVAAS